MNSTLMSNIFVSIASYMDDQLENTVNNLIENAENPENLTFGLCIQDSDDKIERYKSIFTSDKYKVVYVNFKESKGCCWARSNIQSLITDEKYYFQLDAHHRFVKHWDTKCISMLNTCSEESESDKVVLSTYATPCELKGESMKLTHQDLPYKMRCERFYDTRKVRYVPEAITDKLESPQKSYTISAHFIFTTTDWTREIPYDSELYFEGEEDSLSLRSYTNGWKMYYPHEKVCYHYYIRNGAVRHSDNDKSWHKKNDASFKRFYKLLANEIQDEFGLGSLKTIYEYFDESGVDYSNKVIIKKSPSIHQLHFSPLPSEKLKVISKDSADIVLDFQEYVFCSKNEMWNEYKPSDPTHWCHFEQSDETEEYYDIFDSGRDVYIRLMKDMSMIMVRVGSVGEFSLLYKTPILTLKKIENGSKLCIFNANVPNQNTIKYCESHKYDYMCFSNYFDVESTFETYNQIYDYMCYIPDNVYFLNGNGRPTLNQLVKYGNIMSPDFSFKVNNSTYKQLPKNMLQYDPRNVKKNTMLLKTTDQRIIQKLIV